MNVIESRRSRSLIVRLERGEELPAALLRALGEVEVRSAWITGSGSLEVAEVTVYDQLSREFDRTRKIDTPSGVVSLTGNVALESGALSLRLSVVLARETDLGMQLLAGQLVSGRAFSLELCVVAFDDMSLVRAPDPRTGLLVLTVQAGALPRAAEARSPAAAGSGAPAAPQAPASPATPAPYTPPAAAASPARAPEAPQYPPPSPPTEAPVMPQKPSQKRDEPEIYPEVGDGVMHFHFGECTVISSDGDRIRLRQDRDGRMRDVALAMLRIEPPTIHDGKRSFKLSRKN
jgi:predicted DNA-binding protein with PD1-like motif